MNSTQVGITNSVPLNKAYDKYIKLLYKKDRLDFQIKQQYKLVRRSMQVEQQRLKNNALA